MSTVYDVFYTDKSVPYRRAPLAVPAAKKKSFKIGFPSQGFLTRLAVYQLAEDGITAVDFEIELLNSAIPFPPDEYDPTDDPADVLEPYRVQMPPTNPLSATAGNVITLDTDEIGMGYRNLDGTTSEQQPFLYLVVKPISAIQETKWCLFMQARAEGRV